MGHKNTVPDTFGYLRPHMSLKDAVAELARVTAAADEGGWTDIHLLEEDDDCGSIEFSIRGQRPMNTKELEAEKRARKLAKKLKETRERDAIREGLKMYNRLKKLYGGKFGRE